MSKVLLKSFYHISKFKYHEDLKEELCRILEEASSEELNAPQAEVYISRCDWQKAKDFNRPWVSFLRKKLFEHMLEIYEDLGYDGFTLHEIWFQQYFTNAMHGWHTHSGNFTNVYYVDLPNNSSKTCILCPFDQKSVIELDVKEGDIVVFPSFVIHQGPKNLSQYKKTIISYNTNVTYSDAIYANHAGIK